MLEHTFCHIPAIGPKREEELWRRGLCCWRDMPRLRDLGVPAYLVPALERFVPVSLEHLARRNPAFFRQAMPPAELWRAFREFRDCAAFLDIETTGLYPGCSAVTTIALYDGNTIRTYVQGFNLERFEEDVARYRLLITYNGSRFDLPFLETALRMRFPQLHIDLRWVLKSLGYRGGLKSCERQLGIHRDELDGVDGFFAVHLWREYEESGCPSALDTLLAYNIEDVVNLEKLMVLAYNRKIESTPFRDNLRIGPPPEPARPFRPDPALIGRLRERLPSSSWP
jgi:hypothetical protein